MQKLRYFNICYKNLFIYFNLKILEIYHEKYAPEEHNSINIEYDSSDEDLMSHITKQENLNLNEFELFLKTEPASALSNILNWWQVSLKLNFLNFKLKLLTIIFYHSDMLMNFHI